MIRGVRELASEDVWRRNRMIEKVFLEPIEYQEQVALEALADVDKQRLQIQIRIQAGGIVAAELRQQRRTDQCAQAN